MINTDKFKRVGTVTRFLDGEPRLIEEHFYDQNHVRITVDYSATVKGYK